MKSQIIALIFFFCLYTSYSKYYPAEYDLRFEPDYRNCDFQASEEGLCSANWGIILSEVLSNMYCLKQKKANFVLSKQHLIDCVEDAVSLSINYDKCQYFGNTDVFFAALNHLQNNGITTDACYPYTSFVTGDSYDCAKTCSDGTPIKELYKSGYVNMTETDQVKDFLLYQGPAIVLIEAYDELLHYEMKDSTKEEEEDGPQPNYDSDLGYRALKIVGWMTDNGTEYWVAGNSWSQNWAVVGYMYLEIQSPYILSYHGLQLP